MVLGINWNTVAKACVRKMLEELDQKGKHISEEEKGEIEEGK